MFDADRRLAGPAAVEWLHEKGKGKMKNAHLGGLAAAAGGLAVAAVFITGGGGDTPAAPAVDGGPAAAPALEDLAPAPGHQVSPPGLEYVRGLVEYHRGRFGIPGEVR